MLSFSTEFPVDRRNRSAEFIAAVQAWILESPHAVFRMEDIARIPRDGSWSIVSGNHRIDTLIFADGENESAAVRFKSIDENIEWSTDIVFSRGHSDAWVGVRTSRESLHPAISLPPAKKPVVVRKLLDILSGSEDGALLVVAEPRFLTNNDIPLAGRLIMGEAGCHLPVVYVSAGFSKQDAVDVSGLAYDLSGMAHVVVEPNRPFSHRLRIDVGSMNVYGGNVGIYWPDNSGRRSIYSEKSFDDPKVLKKSIVEDVRKALLNRRPLYRCTFPSVQESYSKRTIEYLKSTGSIAVEKYIEAFDSETKARTSQLLDAEREIARLKGEIKRFESRADSAGGVTLRHGTEREFFDDEIVDVVVSTLKGAVDQLQDDGRRKHIITAVIDNNKMSGNLESKKESVKELLRDYRKMTSKTSKSLEDLGFIITEDGKHYKLCYFGDERYTFTLAKTGSDHRGGLNSASDIGKRVF